MDSRLQTLSPLDFLKLLAHELRWQIVTALTHSDYRVQELVDVLHEPQNLVSYHLKQLRDAALVAERRSTADARDIYYSLDLSRLETLYDAVGGALHPALSRPNEPAPQARFALKAPTRVLFLCTENSARSQIAEGILRHLSGSQVEVASAGTTPTRVHPFAFRVLADLGIDISAQRAKHVDDFQGQAFDYVITVCDHARENCPAFPSIATRIHWSLPDPVAVTREDARYEAFAQTARQLMKRIPYFLAQISQQPEAFQ